jgi:hypothetical protein
MIEHDEPHFGVGTGNHPFPDMPHIEIKLVICRDCRDERSRRS